MSVRVRVKVGDPGAHEKKRGQEGRASFNIGQKRNRAAVYRCGVCNLHEAPQEGICEADTEATLHDGVGGVGTTYTRRTASMALEGTWLEGHKHQNHKTSH